MGVYKFSPTHAKLYIFSQKTTFSLHFIDIFSLYRSFVKIIRNIY